MLPCAVARAQEVDVHADEVHVDARLRELDLRGDVRADVGQFHLTSDALHLSRSSRGVQIDGKGKLRFCPCLGTPLALRFSGATVAPPGDLLLVSPVLEVFGLPILWAPWFWLRSSARPGLLPPEIAWRASDGLFLGGGVHLPWVRGDSTDGLDVRAGGYVQGGFATSAALTTPASSTRVVFDRHAYSRLGENGLTVDARGALDQGAIGLAWDLDVVRGARGLYATTELEAASRVWDRAGVEVSARREGMLAVLSARGIARRGGEDLGWDAGGPGLSLRSSGALGAAATWDATADGAVWKTAPGSMGLGRAEGGVEIAERLGPVGARVATRVGAEAASLAAAQGFAGAAASRATLSLPLARGFGDGPDPVRHRIEPELALGAVTAREDGAVPWSAGRGAGAFAGAALVPELGLATSLGRWSTGAGVELAGHAGAVLSRRGSGDQARAALRWRADASGRLYALVAEGGHVAGEGHAVALRARLGPTDGFSLRAHLEARDGIDPIAARALTDAATSVAAGFLSREGVSVGGRANAPLFSWLTLWGGADGDVTQRALLSAVFGVELRDRCGCFALRVTGAHRLGREGVDVWATIDVVPPRPR